MARVMVGNAWAAPGGGALGDVIGDARTRPGKQPGVWHPTYP